MPNLSDHDIKQMDEIWQSAQSEPVVRSLLMRTLEDLMVTRDRLDQNASNSSRPPGSMVSKKLSTAIYPVSQARKTTNEFGARHVQVRGHAKVMCHLMLGMVALCADQLTRLLV